MWSWMGPSAVLTGEEPGQWWLRMHGEELLESNQGDVGHWTRYSEALLSSAEMSFSVCAVRFSSSSTDILATALDPSSPFSRHNKCQFVDKRRTYLQKGQKRLNVCAYYGLRSPPYKLDALEPHMSRRTIETHWGYHHRNYVDSLNKQLEKDDKLYGCTLDELIKVTYNNGNPLPEFNNAAQVWNHDFFWESMQPGGGKFPIMGLLQQIEKDFGSFTNFREKFIDAAIKLFGSGWVWLVVKREEKRLAIVKTANAVNPLVWNDIPLLNLDVWEHAYYLDYKNDRAKYVNVFMDHLVSWDAVMARMARAQAFVNLGEPKIPVA
ncbi:OLC1v1015870C1 [Oldenlandia corymbosa var. corymbosa]|uniref:superoxide dismutase n=1 Tax=Oldenlandia corymbosa var. corymbosa TaxID=529605 RepID=A0AAV1E6C9_OLDCO|nr:OLC1v1015870C1 [Oldenlandia corymbosa var. corymbosa]